MVLRGTGMRQLVEQLRGVGADIVIFDSPPLLSVTDPMLVAHLVDGIVLVVDAEKTGRGAVKRGMETLLTGKSVIIGTLLNKVKSEKGGYGYYYYTDDANNGAVRRQNDRFTRLVPKIFGRWKGRTRA